MYRMADTVDPQWPLVKVHPIRTRLWKSAEACTCASPRNLRCYVEDIFDQEVVGYAGF